MKPCHAWLVCGLLAFSGCTAPALRSQGPEEFADALENNVRLVGDVALPFGNNYIKVEGVALVTNLRGTGEDPAPSPQRAALLAEMQKRGVRNPNQLLASPDTALVLVKGFIPPGAQKGDKFDLQVQTPSRSETSSLRGGWLMETRLTELAVLGNQIRDGHLLAIGSGPVMVDPAADGEADKALLVRGRVLGGAAVLKTRPIGLVLKAEEKSVRVSSQVGATINKRFHTMSHGIKEGVANPKTDEFIELAVHPRYKDNVGRYIRIVRSIALKESPAEQSQRVSLLERQLLDPVTASNAALRLEAIGQEGLNSLLAGVGSSDPEVSFYSAEALAYLDRNEAAVPLAQAAKNEPSFRAYALTALSAMDDWAASDALATLLEVPSAETRYGAFRALWARSPNDPLVRGEMLNDQFSYHVLNSAGPAMIHVTRSYRPEVVLFGSEQRFVPPLMLDAGKQIMVNSESPDRVTVSKFSPQQPDQKRVVSTRVDDVIRAIVELGGTYPDVVQALQQAKACHALESRFEVDAVPDSHRSYERKEEGESGESETTTIEVANPLPDLFKVKHSDK